MSERGGICRLAYRCNVFAKARKQTKEVAECCGVSASLCKSERSAAEADPVDKIIRKNNGVTWKFSSNAKTHRRCAADLLACASAAYPSKTR